MSQAKESLRFITCGSVDDGKSTLIGRLLLESKSVLEDQLQTLTSDSRQFGTQGGALDLALLVDGLQAEREQGITIDVAYRFFQTQKRRYIVADTPGHEQYTRNMATGASTADLAIILIDARKGILPQTRRHSRIVSIMGIKHIVLAVNKMDLVHFSASAFSSIVDSYKDFAAQLGFESIQAIPVSGLAGDNVMVSSQRMLWYRGPSLLEYLDRIQVGGPKSSAQLRMPIQWVSRPNSDFRGFCGRIASGSVSVGDEIKVLPSGVKNKITSIQLGFDKVNSAQAGESVLLTFENEIDVGRGDVVVDAENPPETADQFEARLFWMNETAMSPGRQYVIKLASKETTAVITEIKYREDVNTGAELSAKTMGLNEIATVSLSTSVPLVFDSYVNNRTLGAFILIDKFTNETVGAGMIRFALQRSANIHWQKLEINKEKRAEQKNQTPKCIWFTGLSGSGKSTIANLVEKRLHADGKHTYILDGDNIRHGLGRDLGFTEADRIENIRRIAEVAKLMVDAGLIVLVSFISPFRLDRQMARELFSEGEFLEIFVDTPIEECERRDTKGLYAKARRGELKNFTGIDSPYEAPENPEVCLYAGSESPEHCVDQVMKSLQAKI